MIDPTTIKDLMPLASKAEQAQLAMLHNAWVHNTNAYREAPTKSNSANLDDATNRLEALVSTLTSRYKPDAAEKSRWFKNKQAAFDWYALQGGTLKYSAFSRQEMLVDGRRVLRESVLELLNAELRTKKSTVSLADFDTAADEARLIRAKADREEIRRDDEQRQLDRRWIEREEADQDKCAWLCLLRDSIVHRITTALPVLIHATGGDIARIPDGQAVIDQAIADGCNDIANSGEVDVDILDDEDAA